MKVDGPELQRERYDDYRLHRGAPKWERSLSSETGGRVVRVTGEGSKYSHPQVLPPRMHDDSVRNWHRIGLLPQRLLTAASISSTASALVDWTSSSSILVGPPMTQTSCYIVVVVPQLQRGIQLSGYQTKNN